METLEDVFINPLDSTRGELFGVTDLLVNPVAAALLLERANPALGTTGLGAMAGFAVDFFSHELLDELGLCPLLSFFLLSIACFSAFSCLDRTAAGRELDLQSELILLTAADVADFLRAARDSQLDGTPTDGGRDFLPAVFNFSSDPLVPTFRNFTPKWLAELSTDEFSIVYRS